MSLILVLLTGVGISYSMWNISLKEEKVNTVMTSCFDITYSSDNNNINLSNTYPISDEKGLSLTPYTFTITNNCDINAYYKINLETLNSSNIDNNFMKVSLNESSPKKINTYESTDKVLNNSKISNNLLTGYLPVGRTEEFNLRVWMDYDTTINDIKNDGTDKWLGKVVVVESPVSTEEINKACQDKGGDLIENGECRKYYVKLNNLVNMENIEFGNVSDGKPINHSYNSNTRTWTITYQGTNKWFGFRPLPILEMINHTFYGSFYSTYLLHSSTVEFEYYETNNTTLKTAYFGLGAHRKNNYYSYYFNLVNTLKSSGISNTLSPVWYLQYFGFQYSENLSNEYKLRDYKLVDLTLMFGEGNEPSKEWCDKYLNSYYEYNAEGTLIPIKDIGEPVKTSYFDKIDMKNSK